MSQDTTVGLTSSNLVDYTSLMAQVNLVGQTSNQYLNLDVLTIHSDATCATPTLGSGLVSQFKSTGILIQIPVNVSVDLYLKSQALNTCVLLTSNFNHAPLIPTEPVLNLVSPMSPSRLTSAPGLFGQTLPASSTVQFFSDALCSVSLASGSASAFAQTGISVPLPLNQTTFIYARTLDPIGTLSGCVYMTDFTHSDTNSPFPELLAITPLSPSKDSFTPNIRGTTAPGSVSVSLFTDSACLNLLATGDPADFETSGFNVTLNQNATTVIYAKSIDSLGAPSVCALFTSYTHDNLPPGVLSFLSTNPVSPTNQTTLPRLIGLASSDTDEIIFYDSALCLNTIGFGVRSDFIGIGSVANVRSNNTTQIYARSFDSSDNGSDCTFLTSFVHNTLPPDSPVFVETIPMSPTNLTTTPLVKGISALRTTHLYFFKDDLCTLAIGNGTSDDYEVNGVLVTADFNTITSIYVQVTDLEGNISDCTFHASFSHSSVPAPDPAFSFSVPASPSRASNTPSLLGTADPTIQTVRIFTDPSCTTQVASATRGQFTAGGVTVPLSQNSTNNIYARAIDIYGNFSACVFLTTYIHNNILPLNPTYTSILPLSPNNQSSTPTIRGDVLNNPASQLPPSRVEFFDSDTCVTQLGFGTPTLFRGAGITIDVNINAPTVIYAKSFDAAGNESACTLLTSYIYNILVPAAPIYSSASPTSPSFNRQIRLFGTYGPSSDFMNRVNLGIYSDAACTALVVSSNPTLFTSTGVLINLNLNSTQSLYGQTVNEVGTRSTCQFLTSFTHYNLPPSNLTAIQNANGSVNLSWTPDGFSNPVPRYTVERSVTSGGPYSVLSSQQIGNNFNDQQVSNGVRYYYRVFASNSTGRSQSSTEVNILISAPSPITTNSLVTTVSDSQVQLNWSGFPQNMTYRIFRSSQFAGPFTDLGISTTTTTYIDLGLTNNLTYYYYIKASNPSGLSVQSNMASAVPKANPATPTQLSVTPLNSIPSCGGGSGIRINWTQTSYFDTFNVYKGFPKNTLGLMGSTTSSYYDDCGFGNDNINYLRVRAGWGMSESNGSNIVGFYSSASPQLTLSPGDGDIHLSWTAPTTFSPYNTGDLLYTVYKSLDPDKNFQILVDAYTPRTLLDSVTNNTGAYYYVQAYLIDVNGDKVYVGYPTAVRSANPSSNPLAPTSLIANYVDAESRLQLDWVSPSHFNTFRLYRSSSEFGPFVFVQNINTTFMSSAPLISGMNHFRLTAVWGGHETSPTNVVSFRNASLTGLALTPQSDRLNLSWTAVPGAQDYLVFRSNSSNGPFVNYDVSASNAYSDMSVSVNTGYYYNVRARFSDLTQGQVSNVVWGQTTLSTVPSNISLTVLGDTFIRVDWPLVTAATSYRVERALNLAGPYTVAATTAMNTATIFGLNPQNLYYIRVVAMVSGVPYTSPVETAWTFVPSPAPTGVSGNGQVQVSWTAMAGAVDYDIERSSDGVTFTNVSSNYPMTSFTDSSVVNGNVYFYRIKTNYLPISLVSPVSVGFSPGRIPLVPTQLSAENTGTGSDVTLTWTEVSGRSAFNIYMSTTSGVYGAPIQTASVASGTVVSGLVAGTTYYFTVTSLNGSNESGPSNEIMIIPSSDTPKPLAQFDSSSSILVSWSSVVGADNYNLFRSNDGLVFYQIASGLTSLSYIDSTITPALTYFYRYQSVSLSGTEMSSSLISDPVNVTILPQRPLSLTLILSSTNFVDLSWPEVPSITNYEVLRSQTSGGPYTQVSLVPFGVTSFTDSTVVPGQSYYYVLRTINSSGVRSILSNQVSANLVSGPLNLTALNSLNSIDLSWQSIPGVTGYEVLRSESSSGPFGLVQSSATLSASDTNVVPAQTYYYVVRGVYADGRRSVSSSAVSIIRDGSLRFQVAIELTDTAISSSGFFDLQFDRTTTTFNSLDYDGVTGYQLEVVATNFDTVPRSVGLVNEAGTLIDFITIPANTIQPTLVKNSITMLTGPQKLRLELEQTASDGQLSVTLAKLLVQQVNATKTRLYYPLLSSDDLPANVDEEVFSYSTSLTDYHDFSQAALFTRRATKLDRIETYNAWELEALVSTSNGGEGLLALYNNNTNQIVPSTETRFLGSGLGLAQIPFNEGITQFRAANEGHSYRLVLKCEYGCVSGSVRVHKAGIWVKLSNLTKTSIVYRMGSLKRMISSTTNNVESRSNLNLSLFSNPKVYLQASVETDPLSQGFLNLIYHSSVSGSSGLSTASGSNTLIFPATVNNYLSSELSSLLLNQNYMTSVVPAQGQVTVRSSYLLVETGL